MSGKYIIKIIELNFLNTRSWRISTLFSQTVEQLFAENHFHVVIIEDLSTYANRRIIIVIHFKNSTKSSSFFFFLVVKIWEFPSRCWTTILRTFLYINFLEFSNRLQIIRSFIFVFSTLEIPQSRGAIEFFPSIFYHRICYNTPFSGFI